MCINLIALGELIRCGEFVKKKIYEKVFRVLMKHYLLLDMHFVDD